MTRAEYESRRAAICRQIDAEVARPTSFWRASKLLREAEKLEQEWMGACVARECVVETGESK